jgi:hypothetical protein
MKYGFEKEFNVELIRDNLTNYEKKLTDKFEEDYFSKKEWNHKR